MQLGHVPVALAIATYDWSPEMAAFCVAMHWLPNADSLAVKSGLDKPLTKASIAFERLLPGKDRDRPIEEEMKDPFWTEMGGFHCTVTHSVLFAVVVSALVALFSPHYAAFALVAILAHYAADIGSTVGLPLLWPFTRKKYSLRLFKDSGWWGREMLIGYYRQPMAWVLELGVFAFFAYRLYVVYA